ncbi:alginate O-acetyltransferase AlgX-related protein [Vreelandella zhanjiangensis]|uniref:alginate O-acetyltransferase AlgX-related protein n=1 Tax=Vreelandella zhanjiangensis TaxID=1121960 RepID=UPI00035DE1A3|nr:hypothetical protein [Halomonas zhanjiangensis]
MEDWNSNFEKKASDKEYLSLIKLSEDVLGQESFTAWHYIQYISALYSLGLKGRGAEVTLEAIEIFPDDLSLRIQYAENAMFSSSWDAAISRWQYIVNNFNSYPEGVFWRLALSYIKALRFREARRIADEIESKYGVSQKLNDLMSLIDSSEAQKYIVDVRVKSSHYPCHIDKVTENKNIGKSKDFIKYRLFGWVKVPKGKKCLLAVKNNKNEVVYLDFNVNRGDVKKHFEKQGDDNVEVKCGFDYYIDISEGAYIGILVEETEEWLLQLELIGLQSVLEGEKGWLFLDNDANESVNQFTGKALLSEDMFLAWKIYADNLLEFQKRLNLIHFVASSKEAVLPQYYPHPRGSTNVFEQVSGLLKSKQVNSVSVTKLMSNKEGAYYKTDTHWSDYGAYLAYLSIMERGGFKEVIKNINFNEIEVTGDLGSKLHPERRSLKKVHFYDGPKAVCVFDNRVSGAGSITIWKNPDAYYSKTAVLFGDSFLKSGCLANYFTYSFVRVVVINLPGSLIEEIVSYESPDVVVVQTNDRYLLTPGKIYEKVSSHESPVSLKVSSFSEMERNDMMKNISAYSEEHFYKNKMLEILDKLSDRKSKASC